MKEKIKKYTAKQIFILYEQLSTSIGKAKLANLRRGIGKIPGELPELWGVFLNDIPEEFLSKTGEPTKEEWAIYLTLTLYALHQQGNSENVNEEKISIGKAAAMLMNEKNDDEYERILRRFGPVVTSKDMPELMHHLRSLIQLIKSKGIHLDYVKLSGDIYQYQFYNSRKKVQLQWGQDFYYNKNNI